MRRTAPERPSPKLRPREGGRRHWVVLVARTSLLLFIATACRSHETKKQHAVAPPFDILRLTEPVEYGLEDPECQAEAGLSLFGEQSIYRWNGHEILSQPFVFDQGPGSLTTMPRLVKDIYFNEHSRVIVKEECSTDFGRWQQESCARREQSLHPRQQLKICRSDSSHARQSVEGASMTVRALVEENYRYYLGIRPGLSLQPAIIITFPRIEYMSEKPVFRDGRQGYLMHTMTDNAGFGVIKQANTPVGAFVVFPKSTREEEIAPSSTHPALWEVPWVMSHEFGHYVFYTHVSQYLPQSSLSVAVTGSYVPGLQRTSWPDPADDESGVEKASQDVQAALSGEEFASFEMSAINEGFADIFGYLSRGEDSSELAILPCLEHARAVEQSTFGDGSSKRFSSEHFQFLGMETSTGCKFSNNYSQIPDLSDPHTVGAMIANGLFKMMQTKGADQASRAKLLLGWIDEFRVRGMALGDSAQVKGQTMRAAVLAMAKVIGDPAPNLSSGFQLTNAQCKVVAEGFGGLFGASRPDQITNDLRQTMACI